MPTHFVLNILLWCQAFPEDKNSLWCITSLRYHLFDVTLFKEVILTSEILIHQALSEDYKLTEETIGQINTLFSFLISHQKMRTGEYPSRVDKLFLEWLRCPKSYGVRPIPHRQIQRGNYFARFQLLLLKGRLNISKDADAIERFIQWIDNWETDKKKAIQHRIRIIQSSPMASPIWDTVKFR